MIDRVGNIIAAQVENPKILFSLIEGLLFAAICRLVVPAVAASFGAHATPAPLPDTVLQPREGTTDENQQGRNLTASYYLSQLGHELMFGTEAKASGPKTPLDVRRSAADLLSEYEIQGVFMGRVPKVVLLEKATSRTVTVTVGETIAGMSVLKIEDNYITFKLLGETYEVGY